MEDNDDFTFSIEGKDYTISEKKNTQEKSKKQTLHAPSLGIGAIITGICIVGVFFGLGDFSESTEPLIEKQISQEPNPPQQISVETFMQNGSPMLGNPDAPITLVEFGDYQCHFCNVFYHNTEHEILENFVPDFTFTVETSLVDSILSKAWSVMEKSLGNPGSVGSTFFNKSIVPFEEIMEATSA